MLLYERDDRIQVDLVGRGLSLVAMLEAFLAPFTVFLHFPLHGPERYIESHRGPEPVDLAFYRFLYHLPCMRIPYHTVTTCNWVGIGSLVV